ncbi:hypothetical protein ARMGADRAFT_1031299 [Armillaria gallica]|uniref:Aspartic peptidase DDI1-type domain-containing protein n=1 Tax=Armillaria gallica TaxID=47427 RepID=A0A2H3D979_ARMGA|nr:hypothetical protein ARMGADRAFT_1031299 [Armillaria gallica]
MSSNLVTINMINAYSEEEEEDKVYMDYSQTSKEMDLDEGYNDDTYIQTVPHGLPTSISQRAKSFEKEVTKATPTNPYGTCLNPNKRPSNEEQKGAITWPRKKDNPPPSEPILVDARPSQILDTPKLEDVEMVEEACPAIVGQNNGAPQPKNSMDKKRVTRLPPIQHHYDSEGLMRTVLSAPITIPIGEFMAYSTELRKQLIKELQNHTVKFSDAGKTNIKNMTSIAQVNLVTMEPIQIEPLIRSALITIEVDIGNVNRNLGLLLGQFSNVKLAQGPVVTNAAFFVGNQKISFQLLLGWPWLQGNLISILERLEGTYLVYHDPKDAQNYQELFVLEESWNDKSTRPTAAHLAETEDVLTVGALKMEAGQEIIILEQNGKDKIGN